MLQHRVLEAHELGGLPHPAVDFPLVQPHIFRAEGDVLVDGFLKELVFWVLEHQPHLKAGLAGALLGLPDVLALKEHPAGGGLQQAVQVLDEGGFPGAGVSDDAQVFPPAGGEVHPLQGGPLKGGPGGVDVGELFGLNNRFQWRQSFT